MHSIWQKVRRPFVYPECVNGCKWEVYDVTMAGCVKCGRQHVCSNFAYEGTCHLEQTDEGSRVCDITGYVIPEVRYAKEEYMDHIVFKNEHVTHVELDVEVSKVVDRILDSIQSELCRREENSHQNNKLHKSFIKSIRMHKLQHKKQLPNICNLLTHTLQMEKRINFVCKVSPELKRRCNQNILLCLFDLRNRGFKIYSGNKLQDLVCGLLYLCRSGISYQNRELLSPIPEIARCLPMESRLKQYFNINSKVITSIENEVKLAYRDYLQC